MPVFSSGKYNPNPISKFIATVMLSYTVLHPIGIGFEIGAVALLSLMFLINGDRRRAIKTSAVYAVLAFLPRLEGIEHAHLVLKMFLSLLIIYRMFYLPFTAAKFLICASDVGTIISSMDKMKVPNAISIPIAVMFRFFPSFREESESIKLAMRIRGISKKNPLAYIAYVAIPTLIISSTISDDIAKAAETKCIENPGSKTRYIPVRIKWIDFAYVAAVAVLVTGGTIW